MNSDNFFTENPADITWFVRRSQVRVYFQENGLRQTETIDGVLYASRFFPAGSMTHQVYAEDFAKHNARKETIA